MVLDGGCQGVDRSDTFAGLERAGGALGALLRLCELRLLAMDWASKAGPVSKPEEERA